jgi:phosphoribosylformylglycinamidine (FGAM) synthase-like enzyme
LLFSESASRFVLEVAPTRRETLEAVLRQHDVPHAHIGEVTDTPRLQIAWALRDADPAPPGLLIDLPIDKLKEAWQKPLRW